MVLKSTRKHQEQKRSALRRKNSTKSGNSVSYIVEFKIAKAIPFLVAVFFKEFCISFPISRFLFPSGDSIQRCSKAVLVRVSPVPNYPMPLSGLSRLPVLLVLFNSGCATCGSISQSLSCFYTNMNYL